MDASVPSFQTLYYLLREYQQRDEHAHAFEEVLLPWQTQAVEAMSVLSGYGNIEARHWRSDQPDPCNGGDHTYYSCLERLYALSRMSDLLILPQQRQWDYLHPSVWQWTPESVERHFEWMRDVGMPQWTPSITLEERNTWLRSLGFTEIQQPTFHPFYHEIVDVELAPNAQEPISIREVAWPGFMLGQMMFCRAGVRIRSGAQFVQKDIAEHSHLYWAFVRNNRPAHDASHGWGHNSQWATNFRRDYVDQGAYYYNVDGETDIHDSETGKRGAPIYAEDWDLTLPMRIELLTNRCFIRTAERSYLEFFDEVTYRESKERSVSAN